MSRESKKSGEAGARTANEAELPNACDSAEGPAEKAPRDVATAGLGGLWPRAMER